MRGSIKRQISVIFIGLVVAILLISLGVNAKFLGQYYILNKQIKQGFPRFFRFLLDFVKRVPYDRETS